MSSTVSLSPVTDGLRPDWPAGVQTRAAWLRRLQWQPGARSSAVAGHHGGLRLATLQWLDALARRTGLHANVVRRSMGIWSACAMDWRALAQQQADRGIGRDGGVRAGVMGAAAQTVVQWHISERTIVQPGLVRYAATPALHAAIPGAAASMAPTAKVVAASPAMAYVAGAVRHATSSLSPAAPVVEPSSTQRTGHDAIAAAAARPGSFDNASPMTYAAHPVYHDAPEPTVPALPPTPGDMLYDQAMRTLSSIPRDKVHRITSTVAPAPLHSDMPRMRQAESPTAASAMPGSRTDVVESATPPALVRPPQSSLDLSALVQQKNAVRAQQTRPPSDHPAMSWPDRDMPAQHAAASSSSAPAPGDMLYDQAMRALSPVPSDQARAAVATTAPPPLRFDLPRRGQHDAMTATPATPGSHTQAVDQRDSSAPMPPTSTAATSNIADAPLRRGDIEYVAQRVMRIITREQRREREARGIN